MKRHASIGLLICTISFLGWHRALVSAADEPHTVIVTFHAKAGAEVALAKVIADHFATARRLNLVLAEPHVTVRTSEGDKTAFVDIFTRRDGSVPDNAPPAILAIWTEMAKLTEPRGGKPAIDIVPVVIVR